MIFKSLSSVEKQLKINSGLVKLICDKEYGRKHAYSKLDGTKYSFEYTKRIAKNNNIFG